MQMSDSSIKSPNQYWFLFKLGQLYQLQSLTKQAEEYYLKALKSATNNHDIGATYNVLGLIKMKQRNYQKSQQYFTDAQRSSPDNVEYIFNKLLAKKEIKSWNRDQLEKISLNSKFLSYKSGEGAFLLAKIYTQILQNEALEDALNLFEIAHSFGKTDAEIYCEKGKIQKQLGKQKQAMSLFKNAFLIDRNSSQACYYLLETNYMMPIKQRQSYEQKAQPFVCKKADQYIAKRDFQKASAFLMENLAKCPRSASLRQKIGIVQFEMRNLKVSEDHLLKAIKLDPFCIQAYHYLGMIAKADQQFEKAKELLMKVIEKDDKHAQAHFELGQIYYKECRYKQAEETLSHLTNFNQSYPEAYQYLAEICQLNNDYEKAKSHYLFILQLISQQQSVENSVIPLKIKNRHRIQTPQILLKIGKMFGKMEKYDQAFLFLRTVDENQIESNMLQFEMGILYKSQRNFYRALQSLSKVKLQSYLYGQAYFNMGVIYFETKQYQKAEKCFEISIKNSYKVSDGYCRIGLINRLQYQQIINSEQKENPNKNEFFQKSRSFIQKAIEKNVHNAKAYSEFSMICLHQGKTEQAQKYASLALEKNPNNTSVLMNRGYLHLRLGEVDKAEKQFIEVSKNDEQEFQSEFQLGLIYKHKGNHALSTKRFNGFILKYKESFKSEEAYDLQYQNNKAQFMRVIKQQPLNKRAHLELGRIQINMGYFQIARSCFQNAQQDDQKDTKADCNLGILSLYEKKIDEAETILRRVIQRDPKNVQANFYIGHIEYICHRNLEEALIYLEKGILFFQRRHIVYLYLAQIYLSLGKQLEAEQKILEYLKRYPGQESFDIVLLYTQMLFDQSRFTQALPYCSVIDRKLVQHTVPKENHAQALYLMGCINEQLSIYDRAFEYFKEYIEDFRQVERYSSQVIRRYGFIYYNYYDNKNVEFLKPYCILAVSLANKPLDRLKVVVQITQIYLKLEIKEFGQLLQIAASAQWRKYPELDKIFVTLSAWIEIEKNSSQKFEIQKDSKQYNLLVSQLNTLQVAVQQIRAMFLGLVIKQSFLLGYLYYYIGCKYKQLGISGKPEVYFQNSLKWTSMPEAYEEMTQLFYFQQRYEEAIQMLAEMQRDKMTPKLKYLLGIIFYQKGYFNHSQTLLQQVSSELYPYSSFKLANIKRLKKMNKQAEHLYQQFLSSNPNNIAALLGLASVSQQQKQIALYQKVLHLDEQNKEASIKLAEYFLSRSEKEKAIECLDKIKSSMENDSQLYQKLAMVALLEDDLKTAQEYLWRAIQIENKKQTLLRLLEIYSKLNQQQKAYGICKKLSDKLLQEAIIKFDNRLFEQSRYLCEQALKYDNSNEEVHRLMSILLSKFGQEEESRMHLQKLIEINENNLQAKYLYNKLTKEKPINQLFDSSQNYYSLGIYFDQSNHFQNALECYKVYVQNQKNEKKDQQKQKYFHCILRLGIIYKQLQNFVQAEHYLQSFLQLYSESTQTKISLAQVYLDLLEQEEGTPTKLEPQIPKTSTSFSFFQICTPSVFNEEKKPNQRMEKLNLLLRDLQSKQQVVSNYRLQLAIFQFKLGIINGTDVSGLEKVFEELKNETFKQRERTAQAYCYEGLLKLRRGNKRKAADFLKKAIQINYFDKTSYYQLAKLKFDDGEFQESKNNLLTLIGFDRSNFKGKTLLAKILRLEGRLEQAENFYNQALQIKNCYHEAIIGLQLVKDPENPITAIFEAIKMYKNQQFLDSLLRINNLMSLMQNKPLMGIQKKYELLEQHIDWIQNVLEFFSKVKNKLEEKHFKSKASASYTKDFISLLTPFLNIESKKNSIQSQQKKYGSQKARPQINPKIKNPLKLIRVSVYFESYVHMLKFVFIPLLNSFREDQIYFENDQDYNVKFSHSCQPINSKSTQVWSIYFIKNQIKGMVYYVLQNLFDKPQKQLNKIMVTSFNNLYSRTRLASGMLELIQMLQKERQFINKVQNQLRNPLPWNQMYKTLINKSESTSQRPKNIQISQSFQNSSYNLSISSPLLNQVPQQKEWFSVVVKHITQMMIILIQNESSIIKSESIFLNIGKAWKMSKFETSSPKKKLEKCSLM